jgi:trimethylamine--corrinoid protein Co-methyltransferase
MQAADGDTMTQTNTVQPRLTVLNTEQIDQVHNHSLQILSSVGVRVDSDRAQQILRQAVGPKMADGSRVRIPRELVEWALEVTPTELDIFDRTGALAFRLPDRARFGIGVTALYYQSPETDDVTPFTRKHMETMVRLGDVLPAFDVISTIGIVQDVPPEISDLYATLEMTANTTKPLVILVSAESNFPTVLELLEHLHGDLSSRPFIIPYLNPISPLVINEGTVDKMLTAIERGLPFIYSNYGMAGASTPITPAGTLAILNAELLAGLTLSQLVKEGAPIILGILPAFFDMKGMGSFYDVKSYVVNLACADMMAFYRLPHCGTSGSGMGWGADLIAGGHQWLNHLISCIGQVGLVPFVGDNLGSKAFSPAVIVYANEIIEQARLFAEGVVLDDEALALDEIVQMGPGGSFLTSDLTLRFFRQAYYSSRIFPNLTLEQWQAWGSPQAADLVRRHTRQLLDGLRAPEDHVDLLARGQSFIDTVARRL